MKPRRSALLAIGVSLLFPLVWAPVRGAQTEGVKTSDGDLALAQILREELHGTRIPAAWVAIQEGSQPPRIAAVGVRKFQSPVEVSVSDTIHIGSCTKAFTASLLARLVEQGSLRWESSLEEVLPELVAQIHPDYGSVTLDQLLTHRGGVPANARNWWLKGSGEITKLRREIAVDSLQDAPSQPPGSGYLYSNLGYLLAGLMAAEVTGESWESLMQREVFEPLGLRSAGFGPPGTTGQTDQPWGHLLAGTGCLPMQRDNAAALGPAGTIHLSMADWLRFARWHSGAEQGDWLPESFRRELHRVPGGPGTRYAKGWLVSKSGHVLEHAGSNRMWLATIRIDLSNQRVQLVVCNAGNAKEVEQWSDRVFRRLSQAHGGDAEIPANDR